MPVNQQTIRRSRLTFTGVDKNTDLGRLRRIADVCPHVEFAVLVGSKTGTDTSNRFPSWSYIGDIAAVLPINQVAVHMCGMFSRAIERDDFGLPLEVCDKGFGRVQVNATHYNLRAVDAFAVRARDRGVREVIVQVRGSNALLTDVHVGRSYLHDESGGRGVDCIDRWNAPPVSTPCGFAGGLSAENIDRAVAFARKHPHADIWFDMETGVRTDDWFDLDKVVEVIARAEPWWTEGA